MDREKIIKEYEDYVNSYISLTTSHDYEFEMHKAVLALLKEQDAVVKQWTKEIAEMQLAHAPNDYNGFMSLDEYLENKYKKGIWDGLQIAWNIISEGR